MKYNLNLNNRPFQAIKAGTKKIEGRVPTSKDKTPYNKLKRGEVIIFKNNLTRKLMSAKIIYVRHYPTVRKMLEKEGVKNVLSSGGSIAQDIKSYNKLSEYQKNNAPPHTKVWGLNGACFLDAHDATTC